MKFQKQFLIRLIVCFLAIAANMHTAQAQQFLFDKLFFGTWQNEKGKMQTYQAKQPVYGYNWNLTTDGYNGFFSTDTGLHIGTSRRTVKTVTIASKEEFKNLQMVRILLYVKNDFKFTLKIGELNITKNIKATKEDATIYLFQTENKSGKIEFTIEYPKPQTKAIYIYSLEALTALGESKDNTPQIEPTKTKSFILNRTLSHEHWNTFCLPFDVDAATVKETFKNPQLREFTGEVQGTTMIFRDATEIKAGTPYIIMPSEEVANPTFTNVVCTAPTPKTVSDPTGNFAFIGNYNPTDLKTDGTELFLGAENKLYHPIENDKTTRGLRAFFRIKDAVNTSQGKYNIDTEQETTVLTPLQKNSETPSHVFSIDGKRITNTPHLRQGIYIRNGKKILIQ